MPAARNVFRRAVATLALVGFAPSAANAAGFYIAEQSVSAQGRAFSGEAVFASDASALWYNPALAADLDGGAYVGGLSGLFIKADYADRGSSVTRSNFLTGQADVRPSGGLDGDDPVDPAAIPNFHALWALKDGTRVGLSLNAPFGIAVEYPRDWFGRYESTNSELATYNLQLSAAKRLNPKWAIGGGVSMQYVDVTLESAVPNQLDYDPATGAAIVPADASLKVTGDDISFGLNFGVTYAPCERWRFGAHYRSAVNHDVSGELTFSGVTAPAAVPPLAGLAHLNGARGAEASVELPAIASLAAAYRASDALTLTAQITHFDWDSFDELRLRAEGGFELVTEFRYEDTVNVAAGFEYEASERWTLRGGVQWDPSPARAELRSTRVPDNDRLWLSGGASYQINDRVRLDGALSYVFYQDALIFRTDETLEGAATINSTIDAELNASAVVASIALTARF